MFTLQRFIQPDALAGARHAGVRRLGRQFRRHAGPSSSCSRPASTSRSRGSASSSTSPTSWRCFALSTDVVLKDDLRRISEAAADRGRPSADRHRAGERSVPRLPAALAERIKAIENRRAAPQKGDDILLSVITDGRHAAIDLRLVRLAERQRAGQQAQRPDRQRPPHLEGDGEQRATPGPTACRMPDPRRGADDLLRPRHARRPKKPVASPPIAGSRTTWSPAACHRLRSPSCRTTRSPRRQTAPVQRGQCRPGQDSDRLVARPWAPASTPSGASRPCTISTCRGCPRRSSSARAGSSARATRTRRSRSTPTPRRQRGRHRLADPRAQGPLHRRRDVGRPLASAGSRTPATQANQFALAKAIASGDARLMRKAGLEARSPGSSACATAHFDDQLAIRARSPSAKSGSKTPPAGSRRSRRTSPEGSDPRRRLCVHRR